MPDSRTLTAFNTATASENRIHDDTVASRFGFTGGLVPGVDVFAYLAHAPVRHWGEDWLTRGGMSARFLKPVYDGDSTVISALENAEGGLEVSASARGETCATGSALQRGRTAPAWTIPEREACGLEERPPASPESLPDGRILGVLEETYTREDGLAHIAAVRDDPSLYRDGRIANPAWLLRRANYILADNVKLGPWIHVESDIALHDMLHDGEILNVRACVERNFESKGHRIVILDVQMLCGERYIMSCRHTAIYEPRQVRERS
jgi:hypothetical protein